MLSNPTILITGGTGSFGHAFLPITLEQATAIPPVALFRVVNIDNSTNVRLE